MASTLTQTTKSREDAEQMVLVLNRVEEALAALDQLAGREHEVERVAQVAYKMIEKARNNSLEEWNHDDQEPYKITRCAKADTPYHTSFDGPCGVWVQSGAGPIGRFLCEICQKESR